MNYNTIFMVAEDYIAKANNARHVFSQLSNEQLERIVGNHIQNPVASVLTKLFTRGPSNLFCLRYRSVDLESERISDGFYVGFNPSYVPKKIEYETARKLLEKRKIAETQTGERK